MSIGEKIVELRKKSGLSQAALAEHLHVSRQSVSKWETGQAIPDVDKIVTLSEIFHVTVDDLVKDSHSIQNEQNGKDEFKQVQNKTPGYILMAAGVLLIGISLLTPANIALLGIILFIIGVEWILVKNNLLLVIAWTLFLCTALAFNPWTTGVTTKWIIHAILTGTVYTAITIGIIQRVFGILLLFFTVKKIGKALSTKRSTTTR